MSRRPVTISTHTDFAEMLGVPTRTLTQLAFCADLHYRVFRIPKRGGVGQRVIAAPSRRLKGVQRWIEWYILSRVQIHECALGFRREKSTVDNAARHVGCDYVLNMDLKDFFPTISAKRVYGVFCSLGYSRRVAVILTRLCTFEGKLPQGSPCSPSLSNIVAHKLDRRLSGLCEAFGANYSRYADDITISGRGHVNKVIEIVRAIITQEGFEVNERKTRVQRAGSRQIVTGLCVNDVASVPRPIRRRLRAVIHQFAIGRIPSHMQLSQLEGWLAYVAMVDRDAKLVLAGKQVIDQVRSSTLSE